MKNNNITNLNDLNILFTTGVISKIFTNIIYSCVDSIGFLFGEKMDYIDLIEDNKSNLSNIKDIFKVNKIYFYYGIDCINTNFSNIYEIIIRKLNDYNALFKKNNNFYFCGLVLNGKENNLNLDKNFNSFNISLKYQCFIKKFYEYIEKNNSNNKINKLYDNINKLMLCIPNHSNIINIDINKNCFKLIVYNLYHYLRNDFTSIPFNIINIAKTEYLSSLKNKSNTLMFDNNYNKDKISYLIKASNDFVNNVIEYIINKVNNINTTNNKSVNSVENKNKKLKLLKDNCLIQKQKYIYLINKIKEYEK